MLSLLNKCQLTAFVGWGVVGFSLLDLVCHVDGGHQGGTLLVGAVVDVVELLLEPLRLVSYVQRVVDV